MIYTVTLNPALDYVIQTDHFKAGQINRNKTENIYFGGKGINVSCILNELGIESTALGFIAGFTGKALKEGLDAMGIHTDFTEVENGFTRINVKLKSDEETEINGRGPQIEPADFESFLQKIRTIQKGDILILSGSIPSCMAGDTYEQIIQNLDSGVRVVADAEKDLLLKILKYRPFLIKPNLREMEATLGIELRTMRAIRDAALLFIKLGVQHSVVSMGAIGAMYISADKTLFAPALRVETKSTVGAGDAMIGGMLLGYEIEKDMAKAFRYGIAAGAASVMTEGTQLIVRSDFETLLDQVKVQEV